MDKEEILECLRILDTVQQICFSSGKDLKIVENIKESMDHVLNFTNIKKEDYNEYLIQRRTKIFGMGGYKYQRKWIIEKQ